MAACAQCAAPLPRGATACPTCGTPTPPRASREPAKPAAKAATKVVTKAAPPIVSRTVTQPVVKAVAERVVPAVKGGTDAVVPRRQATPKAAPPAAAPVDAPTLPGTRTPSRRVRTAAPAVAVPAPVVDEPAPPTRRAPSGDVIGDADERDPNDPVVPLPPRPAGVFDELFEPVPPGGRTPLPWRVLRADWTPTLATVLPALVATVLVAALAATAAFVTGRPGGDGMLFADVAAGRWVRYVCATVGLAFGAPLRAEARGEEVFGFGYAVRVVPLTVTLLSLAALWWAARRAHQRAITPDRQADAVRAAGAFAVGIAAVTAFARWDVTTSQDGFGYVSESSMAFAMDVWKAGFWAFVAAFVVVWAAGGPLDVPASWRRWALAAKGALAGLAAGTVVGFLLLVGLGYAYADRAGAETSDVTSALPLALAFAASLGAMAFGVFSGGTYTAPLGERQSWSLWSPWVPDTFVLAMVVPAFAVLVGAYVVTRRGGVSREEALRACGLMWVPAAGAWLLLDIIGTVSLGQNASVGYVGSLSASVSPWAAVLVAGWFGAGGWVAGRLLLRRPAEPTVLP